MTLQFKLCDVQSDLFARLNSDDPLAGPGVGVGPGVTRGPEEPCVCGVGPPTLSTGVQQEIAGGEALPSNAVVRGEDESDEVIRAGQVGRQDGATVATHETPGLGDGGVVPDRHGVVLTVPAALKTEAQPGQSHREARLGRDDPPAVHAVRILVGVGRGPQDTRVVSKNSSLPTTRLLQWKYFNPRPAERTKTCIVV